MRRSRPVVLFLLAPLALALLAVPPVAAQEGPGAGEPQRRTERRELPDWDSQMPAIPWKRLAYGTAVVVALICIGVYVLKKLNGGSLGGGRYIQVMEARPLGRHVQLFVVKVGDRVLVLAYGGETVTPVAEMTEEDLPEPPAPEGLTAGAGFGSLFRKMTGEDR